MAKKKVPAGRRNRKAAGDGVQADVILASGESNMDLFWATRFPAPDPYPFFRLRGRKYLVASDLEIGRARSLAKVHHVLPYSKIRRRLVKAGVGNPSMTDVLVAALLEKRVDRARVPHDFPLLTADRMRAAGIEVFAVEAPFWPERVTKTPDEVDAIREAARGTSEAIEAGIDLIRRSVPRTGYLRLEGRKLTSERVREAIHDALRERGLEGRGTIVAGGEQGVDPHDRGSGPLPSGYPVIIDCFPRSEATGFHADITRTVFRGRPKPEHLRMWEAVREAHLTGCRMATAGTPGKTIHQAIRDLFVASGFETGPTADGRMRGFFHGTGHGLGLDVHEPPFFSHQEAPLVAGMVITIEPGLYYPGLGGIRIEDDVVVGPDGAENLVPLETEFVTQARPGGRG